jgi:hypothetical protein
MTVTILSMTASSPDAFVASNLQFDTTFDSSASPTSASEDVGDIIPDTSRLCRAESAMDVIGPVESGERMIAKKGASKVGSGIAATSTYYP